jgi:hypothetical protein
MFVASRQSQLFHSFGGVVAAGGLSISIIISSEPAGIFRETFLGRTRAAGYHIERFNITKHVDIQALKKPSS